MNSKFNLTTKEGKAYDIDLPEPSPCFESKFVFSFAKSGSTLLNDLLFTYCPQVKVPVVSVYDQAFLQGVNTHEVGEEVEPILKKEGYLFSGFRHFPNFDFSTGKNKVVLLVRDPRDMVVSRYYSMAKSHVIPKGVEFLKKNREKAKLMSIDDFAIQHIKTYVAQQKKYARALEESTQKVYRYEDVIYEKENWLSDILKYLEIDRNPSLIRSVVKKFDVIPKAENEDLHIRQVHPGNYKKKLKPETIEQISNLASDFLRTFDYER